MLNITLLRTVLRLIIRHYYERAFVRLLITLIKAAVCAPSRPSWAWGTAEHAPRALVPPTRLSTFFASRHEPPGEGLTLI